jgi:hypothetical protein
LWGGSLFSGQNSIYVAIGRDMVDGKSTVCNQNDLRSNDTVVNIDGHRGITWSNNSDGGDNGGGLEICLGTDDIAIGLDDLTSQADAYPLLTPFGQSLVGVLTNGG